MIKIKYILLLVIFICQYIYSNDNYVPFSQSNTLSNINQTNTNYNELNRVFNEVNYPNYYNSTNSPGTTDGHFVLFDDLILMQSTTIKDVNGVEIYEKDIVKFQSDLYVINKLGSGYFLYDLNCELDEKYDGNIGRFDCENFENFLSTMMEVKGNIITYNK